MKKLNILIVEDDENDAFLLARHIKKGGYDIEWERVYKKEDYTNRLNDKKWDFVFCDYDLPGFSGVQAVKILREKDKIIPCIMNSGKRGEEVAVEAMMAGANDYLVKGNYDRLIPAMQRELKNYETQKEKEKDRKIKIESDKALMQSYQELLFLNKLSKEVNSTLSLQQVVDSALRVVFDFVKPDVVMFFLIEKNDFFLKGELINNPEFKHKKNKMHKVGEYLSNLVATQRKSIYLKNIHNDPKCQWKECRDAELISFAVIPLQSGDKVIGVLLIASSEERDFSELPIFLDTASNSITISLQNAILYEKISNYSIILEDEIKMRRDFEEALSRSEENLRITLNSIGDAVIATDVRGNISQMNNVSEILTEWKFNEAKGKPFDEVFKIVNSKTRESVKNPIKKVIRNGNAAGLSDHTMLVSRYGKKYHIADSVSPIKNKAGNIEGAVIVFRDISEEYVLLEKIHEGEKRLRYILNATNDGLWDWDLKTGSVYWSPQNFTMLEYEPDEFVVTYDVWRSLTNEEDLADCEPVIQEALRTGKSFSVEFRLKKKDGSWKWILSRGKCAEQDKKGNPLRMVGTHQDLTDRKQAEKKLRESETNLREAQRMAHLGNWFWDVKTGDVEWSNEVYKIFYLDPKKFRPKIDSIMKLSPWQEEHERDKELIERSVKSHEPGFYEQKFLRPDGSIGYYFSTFQGIYDNSGDLTAMKGTVQDITERKNVENKINELNKNLNKLVEERTKELEEVNNNLQAFSYSVSHDLKTPLRHIDGYLTMLKSELKSTDGNIDTYYIKIRDSITNMTEMIDALLSFSRLNFSKLEKTKTSINMIINDIIKDYEDELKDRCIEWKIDNLPEVFVDPKIIKNALGNLISNAIKFTANKKKAVISIGVNRSDSEYIEFFIKDNGAGFEMDYYDKLFNVFQRLHSEREFKGIGIGLANVKRIITKHGGEIYAKGSVNKGATFYFKLPVL